jgi:integrase
MEKDRLRRRDSYDLDAFRASRNLSSVTSLTELQTLRQFFGFCFERKWISENIARRIKGPRNIKPNDVEPYTANEVTKIITACDTFGRGAYERARARAMVLLLRFTALRIGDVVMLARDRVTWDGGSERWRVFLRTEKTGAPVFLPIPDALKQVLDAVPNPRGSDANSKYYFWNGLTSDGPSKALPSAHWRPCSRNRKCGALTPTGSGTRSRRSCLAAVRPSKTWPISWGTRQPLSGSTTPSGHLPGRSGSIASWSP